MTLSLPIVGRAQFAPPRVETAPVVEMQIQSGSTFVGTAVPIRTSIVGSEIQGKVIELLVDEGIRVKAGDPLARLKVDTFEIELAAARSALRLREAELAELKNGSRPEEIKQAKARLGSAEADMQYWSAQKERIQDLFQDKVRSQEQVNDAQRWLERAEQQVLEARANLEMLEIGPRIEKIQQAQAQVEIQSEQVRLLEDRIAKHTIPAPFDGIVTVKMTEVGQWIDQGDPVVEVAEIDHIEIEAAVPELDIVHVNLGDSATVSFDALPSEVFTGLVSVIVPKGDPKSRTFPVKVRIENKPFNGGVAVKESMFARVTLAVGEAHTAHLVPKDALVLGGPAPAVYVVEPDKEDPNFSSVRLAPVEIGGASGELIEIHGEIKAGDQVVVLGNERLFPGQKVMASARPLAESSKEPAAPVSNGVTPKKEQS